MTSAPADWSLDPAILLALAGWTGVYAWRFRASRREAGARGASAIHAAAFAGGLLVLLAATVSPIATLGDERLFSMHMLQHVLLGDVAPALLLLSLSRVMMRPATRRLVAVERRLGALAHPITLLAIWVLLLWGWHIPALYDAALESPVVHAVEHASFFTAGIALWWAIIQPVPMRHRMDGMKPLAYVAGAKVLGGALGVYLTWVSSSTYSFYEDVPRTYGLSLVEDLNVGGAIMMTEQSIALAIAAAAIFIRMLIQSEEAERRRERLEDALRGA